MSLTTECKVCEIGQPNVLCDRESDGANDVIALVSGVVLPKLASGFVATESCKQSMELLNFPRC